MMNKQHSNEIQSARKKLLAAVSMLLVACVMTISSTYAWFTLSTAPEVKGITTTVGANGNLEIALGTYETVYGSLVPGSGEGDSIDAGKDVTEANTTWGNLIDLSHSDYGLSGIVLYPARLNASGTTIANVFSPLSFPKYGSDGRIMELVAQTLLGKWDASSTGFMAKDTPDYAGVNAIGSASSMTPREFAVRNNKNAIESNRVSAVASAQYAINNYSGDLAALAIANQNSGNEVVIDAKSVEALNSLILKLEDANADIAKSIKASMMLFLASMDSGLTDDQWKLATATLEAKTLSETLAYIKGELGISSLPTQINDPITKQAQIASDLTAAKAALAAAISEGDEDYAWGEIKNVVGKLLNYDGILICGETIQAIKDGKNNPGGTDNAFDKVTQAAMNGGLTFTFDAGSGIFADIAEMTGSYNATLAFPNRDPAVAECVVEGITLDGLKRPVDVQSASSEPLKGEIGIIYKALENKTAPGAATGTEKAITDTYGYTVDLLFRTNAADSYLQLQTAAANRIYEDSDNEAIKGSGSNMTFTINGEYTKAKIDEIAKGIKVVFYKTGAAAGGAADILGVATLGNGVVTGNNYKLDLVLQNYNITSGVLNTTGAKTDDTATVMDESCALTALSANTVQKVTALVYLDGDIIDNGDIGVAARLEGQLNLQFSSSAQLDPMDNNDLMKGTTK